MIGRRAVSDDAAQKYELVNTGGASVMVGAGAGGNVGGTAGCFLGSWVEDTHQVALVVDALCGGLLLRSR